MLQRFVIDILLLFFYDYAIWLPTYAKNEDGSRYEGNSMCQWFKKKSYINISRHQFLFLLLVFILFYKRFDPLADLP